MLTDTYQSGRKYATVKPKPKLWLNSRWKKDLPVDEIAKLYEKGYSRRYLAKKYGVCVRPITLRLKLKGIKLRTHKEQIKRSVELGLWGSKKGREFVKIDYVELENLWKEGKTLREIGTLLGTTVHTITRRLRLIGYTNTSANGKLRNAQQNEGSEDIAKIKLKERGYVFHNCHLQCRFYGKRMLKECVGCPVFDFKEKIAYSLDGICVKDGTYFACEVKNSMYGVDVNEVRTMLHLLKNGIDIIMFFVKEEELVTTENC